MQDQSGNLPDSTTSASSEEARWRSEVLGNAKPSSSIGASAGAAVSSSSTTARPDPISADRNSSSAPSGSSASRSLPGGAGVGGGIAAPSAVSDEFFDPIDQALINRLTLNPGRPGGGALPSATGSTTRSPERGGCATSSGSNAGYRAQAGPGASTSSPGPGGGARSPVVAAAESAQLQPDSLLWEDRFQTHLTAAMEQLFKCEECLTTSSAAEEEGAQEEARLQAQLDAANQQAEVLLKERQELETEIHDLQGDTDATDFAIKSTGELRRLIQTFELDMANVQAELESRIKT
ncbi:unnamed protein product [Amoebophrya sp. A25]|nr:unnamed protein product [Amoebophrya sp. A25]|eukprot:GSA25T00000486001.1